MASASDTISQGNLRVLLEHKGAAILLTVQGKVKGQWLSIEGAEELPTKIDPKVSKDKLHALTRVLFDFLWPLYRHNYDLDNPVVAKDESLLSITTHDGRSFIAPDLETFNGYLELHEPISLLPICQLLQGVKLDWLKKVPPKVSQAIKHYRRSEHGEG